jgi:hypothetical protein
VPGGPRDSPARHAENLGRYCLIVWGFRHDHEVVLPLGEIPAVRFDSELLGALHILLYQLWKPLEVLDALLGEMSEHHKHRLSP